MLEIAHAVSDGDKVERFVGKPQVERVALFERKELFCGFIGVFQLFLRNTEHAFREVNAGDAGPRITSVKVKGNVARAGGDVENVERIGRFACCAGSVERTVAPHAVQSERHGCVHEVVGRGNRVEHLLDLLGLLTVVTVRIHQFRACQCLVIHLKT
jgi:hypothetical protein